MISNEQMEELRKLKELLDADILSKEEFEEKKAMILKEDTPSEKPEKPPVEEATEPAPQKAETEPAPVATEPKKEEPAVAAEAEEVKASAPTEKENTQGNETIKMEMPSAEAGAATAATAPVAKKKSMKPIIIGVVAALVVLILIIAAIGGSGSSNSDSGSTGSDSSEYSEEEEPEEEEAVLDSISAEYSGDTEKGTVLDEDNDGITVTASYDDGTTEEVYGWTVEEPKTLKAGKTATVTINYEGQTYDLEVKCTSISKKKFKKSCKTIGYNELARNPEKNEGENIKISGQIIQVIEDGSDSVQFRVGTKDSGYGSYYDDVFLVTYTYSEGESRMLEDDMVTMWGTYGGTYTYESTGSGNITVPLLYAQYAEIK